MSTEYLELSEVGGVDISGNFVDGDVPSEVDVGDYFQLKLVDVAVNGSGEKTLKFKLN